MFKQLTKKLCVTACFLASGVANAALIVIDSSSEFVVPEDVSSISVLAIGGGGAGAGSHWGGGGSGYLAGGVFSVSEGDIFNVTIGQGGQAAACAGNSCYGDSGTATMFGDLLTADGGIALSSFFTRGGAGGSGGGGAGNMGFGGAGGTGGSDGVDGRSYLGGLGQGTEIWNSLLTLITEATVTAGSGGAASAGSHSGGGGGGGILIDGIGLLGGQGNSQSFAAGEGGFGYGAGGGSGGYNGVYQVGGSGANGVAIVQYNSVAVSEPPMFAILALGVAGLMVRRRKAQ
ncbi:PEP-CTERM sorting domain-containing protein [Psychrosphaera ytuae]|uniref:PEP-CTERM sorting domain-containing protein n=1 Tax=Psychrosphaera ytuae TaxID=2820710 RepID=A0A975DB50_9GAMM|nr:PEP-CTERM sorting domain-containing protein [Psychrosphaera ytuae]QTH63907.1 PEP-CTERM sorting domain-containing protein [Psychrosphaera ytuae]